MPADASPKVEVVVSDKSKGSRNMTPIYMAVIAIVFLAIGFFASGSMTGAVIADQNSAAAKAMDFINNNLVQTGSSASLVGVSDVGSFYLLNISYMSQEIESYVSKDGKYFIPSAIDMDTPLPQLDETAQAAPQPAEVPKSDRPTVELFVMSHCPYGTQAEKGIIPVVELLGDKIDSSVKFVYYAMHGKTEIDEQTRQYCIQKEQNTKYLSYLKCFLDSSNSEQCLASAGIDTTKLNSCVAAADNEFSITKNFDDKASWLSGNYPLFNVNKADNEKYGIGGSPTLVINGVKYADEYKYRNPDGYKTLICSAFNTEPDECSTQLSSVQPSPGFGYSVSASGTAGSCG